MFEMGAETMRLPLEEKMKFEQGDEGRSCGLVPRFRLRSDTVNSNAFSLRRYKAAGANAVDETGALDTVEFLNVSKDDALAWPETVHCEYPSTVNARMENTIRPFVEKSVEINSTLLDVFNDRLDLPEGTLASKHKLTDISTSETRCIKNPPRPGGVDDAKTALGAHTDFGSLVSWPTLCAAIIAHLDYT